MGRRRQGASPGPCRPPQAARWVLCRLLRGLDRDDADRSLGDLFELKAQRRGLISARWWYRRQVLGFLIRSGALRGSTSLRSLVDDLRHASRALVYRPGSTLLAVLILGAGIGANTVVFSVVDPALFRPLPFPEADRLVSVRARRVDREMASRPRYADFLQWSASESRVADAFAAYGGRWKLLRTADGVGEEAVVMLVSPETVELSGAEILIGRGLLPEDFTPAATPTAVVTRELWQRRLEGTPEAIGQTLELNGVDHVVVGVVSDFPFSTLPAQALTPLKTAGPGASEEREPAAVIARLRAGATPQQLAAELRGINVEPPAGGTEPTERIPVVLPIREELYGWAWERYAPFLGVVGFVLLLVTANTANLMLVTAANRREELAVRAALGAGRWRLARQMAAEVALITGGAIGAGTLLSYWGTEALLALDPLHVANVAPRFDLRMAAFAATLGVVAGGLAGVWPALFGVQLRIARSLGASAVQATSSTRRVVAQRCLMLVQISCCLILLTGAGLLTKTTLRMHGYDPGIETENLLTFYSTNDAAITGPDPGAITLLEQLLERMRAVPGVRHVSAQAFGGSLAAEPDSVDGVVTLEGEGSLPAALTEDASYSFVGREHFEALGLEPVHGRSPATAGTDSRVAVINEKAARRWWPKATLAEVVGRRLKLGPLESAESWLTVIGVTPTTGPLSIQMMEMEPGPRVYLPFSAATAPLSNIQSFYVRARSEPLALTRALGVAAEEVVPGILLRNPQHVKVALQEEIDYYSASGEILTWFASFALVLALTGIYGVVAQGVARRTREIGIRKALGAQASHLIRSVAGDSLAVALFGIVVGLGLSGLLTRILSSMLYGTDPLDPVVFGAMAAFVAITTAAAAYVPALRATRLDPMIALRDE